MSNIADIVKGISQAAANAYDGALDEEGNKLQVGLMRDKETKIQDKRVMDGFGVAFSGNNMTINYHREVANKEVMDNGLKTEVESAIEEVASFLKKEYKKVTGETLSLKKLPGDVIGNVQTTSRVRSFVQASCHYEIQGADKADTADTSKRDVDSAIKSFLELGKKAKRPENEEISAGANEK
tara:strand:- start:4426 stop:4971 length:546 start_codon:yes stop_codon:yes gene_type:complete